MKKNLSESKQPCSDGILVLYVKWDDKRGPTLEASYPARIQEKIPVIEIGLQLFSASTLMFGGSFKIEPGGLLLPLANINRSAYVYFGSFPDPRIRSGYALYMVGTIAPRISYMDSLSIKQLFANISFKINKGEAWDISDLHAGVVQAIEGNQ
nr:hypothetical protein [Candidatus Sigynarchaeota archaeon]